MALAIPVAWRDEHRQGLSGVVEICASDFTNTRLEDASVHDFMALVNKKVGEETPRADVVREVKQLLLHGVRVRSSYRLEYIIPDLMGSSPRLLATMRIRTKGVAMMVFFRTLSRKTATIECTSTDTVGYIKARIEAKEGIPPEDQRLTYAGKQLRGDLPLSFYNIRNESTLHLSARVLGGFTIPPRTFADVSDGSILTAVEFSPDAPEWRWCSQGLNIEGRCLNRNCRAFRRMIIDRKKFEVFNLIRDDNVRCPICKTNVKLITCGLYDCCWRFEGVKANTRMCTSSPWEEARGYVYHRFDADENNGSVEWTSLVITTKPPTEAVAAWLMLSTESVGVSEGDTCSICWSPFGSPVKRLTTTLCGHSFHRACSQKWSASCKHNNTEPSCPICRRTF
ncbi:hypothetical protein PF008_g23983 [Phytophthora fragariae]|uniref:RING-type domain-containing protein n=2 Tax=Phytophthora fragariae TaxID=53985 RepID=A0A6G0QPV4_9STRA|nr:hypothetical protein PF008_g23983 [Phytophthora fragariae]